MTMFKCICISNYPFSYSILHYNEAIDCILYPIYFICVRILQLETMREQPHLKYMVIVVINSRCKMYVKFVGFLMFKCASSTLQKKIDEIEIIRIDRKEFTDLHNTPPLPRINTV